MAYRTGDDGNRALRWNTPAGLGGAATAIQGTKLDLDGASQLTYEVVVEIEAIDQVGYLVHLGNDTEDATLVRTDTSGRPQEGISFLLVDMDSPGVSVEPILTMAGDHEVNQVFFEDVRVPLENLIGEENQGWRYAKYLLDAFAELRTARPSRAIDAHSILGDCLMDTRLRTILDPDTHHGPPRRASSTAIALTFAVICVSASLAPASLQAVCEEIGERYNLDVFLLDRGALADILGMITLCWINARRSRAQRIESGATAATATADDSDFDHLIARLAGSVHERNLQCHASANG